MSRKIFLSFLGATPYQETRYYLDTDRADLSAPMYYAQEHLLRKHIYLDEIIIFSTTEAERQNYKGRIAKQQQSFPVLPAVGLESVLARLQAEGVIGNYRSEAIPNGYTEAEIWAVFQTVYDQLQPGDEVVFDVTFGFRSLPMLVLVLLNYARNLKNIHVPAIYYGNYEAGRAEKEGWEAQAVGDQDKEQARKRVPEAPILRLDAFVQLQDWTHAAQSFSDGNVLPLAHLAGPQRAELSNSLRVLAETIQTCRGMELAYELDIDQLKVHINELEGQSDVAQQLRPLLSKINAKLAPFHSQQLGNGFAAVEWCIQHNMVQQGITFLQETLQSYLVEKIVGQEFLTNRVYRYAANGALGGYTSPRRTIEEKNRAKLPLSDQDIKECYAAMLAVTRSFKGLSKLYRSLTGEFRNDINHCGFRDEYASPQELKKQLSDIYQAIKALNL
ncbi:MAG: hypothetical protein DA408_20880 [Bacteroidetes bacterium]|nr:MAG: hypothetical protein C7N36_17525 [Bacteroidota bacterium]PTM08250.1 MAG: hypothetical protein DA408_20880 [Bacteroidota bacterium]